jgi:hypothetical protein
MRMMPIGGVAGFLAVVLIGPVKRDIPAQQSRVPLPGVNSQVRDAAVGKQYRGVVALEHGDFLDLDQKPCTNDRVRFTKRQDGSKMFHKSASAETQTCGNAATVFTVYDVVQDK